MKMEKIFFVIFNENKKKRELDFVRVLGNL